MDIRSRTVAISPELGVTPPSSRLLHNSTRCAPPFSAATADSTESTQISRRILSFIGSRFSGGRMDGLDVQELTPSGARIFLKDVLQTELYPVYEVWSNRSVAAYFRKWRLNGLQ